MLSPARVTLSSVTEDAGNRLDRFLQDKLPQYSRSLVQEWIKAGRVLVNGRAERSSYTVRGGETIQVEPQERPPLNAVAEDLPIEILYEDADVIAVNKPAGMVVHAGAGRHSGTLVNALIHRFQTLSAIGAENRPGIVHRLDRVTSGVLLVARNDAAHENLADQFQSRTIEKTYIALVHGVVKQDRGRIDKPIARDPVRRTKMTARLATGRSALTEYRVLRRFPKFTLLEVKIATGRTHQIRVHLASLRHSVAGDNTYGAPPRERIFLHAQRISFDSPSTGARITVEAPLPVELEHWLQEL
jgi:23S rRNA pseudouridine1911/1915/1917 synthase